LKKKELLSLLPYILILPLYILGFIFIESQVTVGKYVSFLPLDDFIPFVEVFVVPYVLWYPLMFFVGLTLLFSDRENFKRYMVFIGLAFFSIIVLNFLFPNVQNLRPNPLPRDNFFTEIIKGIYEVDTNANVCPSMHVVGTFGAVYFSHISKKFNKKTRICVLVIGVLITLSTVFIKQHSILDVIVALPYGAVCCKIADKHRRKKMKKIAIIGYGNLGRGVEAALNNRSDAELTCVVTRRNPEDLKIRTAGVKVISMNDIDSLKGKVDALIICGGSATDLPEMTPRLARDFNVVDSFDTHAKIPEHFKNVDREAKLGGNIAMISVGWDPGMFSVNRVMAKAILPDSKDYTFWGRGVSQGHSDAIRRIEGVLDARQYTVPIEDAVNRAKSGEMPDFTTREKHLRECFVVAQEGADKERIEKEIKNMPNYFADYDTTVNFVTLEELQKNHKGLPHGGRVIVTGKTGMDKENSETVEYSLTLDSNPEFTASVLVSYTLAMLKMKERGMTGCKTVFDVTPYDLTDKSYEELLQHML